MNAVNWQVSRTRSNNKNYVHVRSKLHIITGLCQRFSSFKVAVYFGHCVLEEIKGTAREGKGYEIACAQLCGNSHYRMRGFLTIDTEDEFQTWLDEQAEELGGEEDDDDDW